MFNKIDFLFILIIILIIIIVFMYLLKSKTTLGGGSDISLDSKLKKEYGEWEKNNSLRLKLWDGKTFKERYEISNMLEWILLEKFNKVNNKEQIKKELEGRFTQKKITPNLQIGQIVDCIFSNGGPVNKKINWKISNDGSVQIGQYLVKYSPERINILINKASQYEVVVMLMKYASMLIGGQQWNIPRAVYKYVVEKHNISLEGFASPINSQLLAICPDKCNFCSLFPETDAVFGSLGSVFDISLVGRRAFLNPPYVLEIMNKVADKIIKTIDEAEKEKKETLIILTVVAWLDAPYHENLLKYKNTISFHLKAKEYAYENSNNLDKKLIASFNSTLFVISYPPPKRETYEGIIGEFKTISYLNMKKKQYVLNEAS